MYDVLQYTGEMALTISVRLDEASQRALAELEATGMTRSQAIRIGLQAAAKHLHDRERIANEAAALAADENDRAEMAVVRELMEDLRAPW